MNWELYDSKETRIPLKKALPRHGPPGQAERSKAGLQTSFKTLFSTASLLKVWQNSSVAAPETEWD